MNGSIFYVTADKQIMRILIFFILQKILFYSFKKNELFKRTQRLLVWVHSSEAKNIIEYFLLKESGIFNFFSF